MQESPVTTAVRAERRHTAATIIDYTQALLAFIVILATAALVLMRAPVPQEWTTLVGLVIGFYFGRVRVNGTH